MKKYFKIGCLSFISIFAIIVLIGFLLIDSPETNNQEVVSEKQKIPPKPILTDSIWLTILPKNFRVVSDDFKKTAFYYHPLTPRYINQNWIYPYLGKNGNDVYLRLKLQYESDDWLFIKKVQFLIDGEVVDFSTGNFERDNEKGRIWEWADLPVKESTLQLLTKISESKSTKVRYTGSQYHQDREMTNREKSVIKEILAVYLKSKEYR